MSQKQTKHQKEICKCGHAQIHHYPTRCEGGSEHECCSCKEYIRETKEDKAKRYHHEITMATTRLLSNAQYLFELGLTLEDVNEVIKMEYERLHGVYDNGR